MRRSRACHFFSSSSGCGVTTMKKLAVQRSPASGAFASVATCESRANTNSPCSLGSPATSGQMGVFHRDS